MHDKNGKSRVWQQTFSRLRQGDWACKFMFSDVSEPSRTWCPFSDPQSIGCVWSQVMTEEGESLLLGTMGLGVVCESRGVSEYCYISSGWQRPPLERMARPFLTVPGLAAWWKEPLTGLHP